MIVVCGASGRLGSRVAARLGGPVRLLFRDPAKVPAGVDAAVAEYGDSDAVRHALTGADTVFMVSAAESPDRVDRHLTFIDAAAAAGVRHLVYTSFAGAAPDAVFTLARDHWATEEHIRRSGPAFTFLRDNLYADFVPFLAGDDGVIRGPAAEGRAAFVAQDDIADAAAAVLRDPAPHAGRTYDLTGPAALTLTEAARALSEATGRHVRYHPESVEEAYASRTRFGAPQWQVEAWVSTYTAIAAGELAAVSDDLPELVGRPATPLAAVLRAAAGS
jgi:uncharacterized protein YbjT (DUF2867 family)